MKTLIIFYALSIGFIARAQYNFSITNEELEAHEIVVLPYNDAGSIVYEKIFENIEDATRDDLLYAFQRWYQNFYNSNVDISYWKDGDGKYKMDFQYVFRFWNAGSWKTVTAKTEFRFYAQDGRARVVIADICYNLSEADLLTPNFVKRIRNVSRNVDALQSDDPLYPYTMEGLDKEDSSMKKRWVKAGDLVILKIIASLEEALYNFEDQEEEDKW